MSVDATIPIVLGGYPIDGHSARVEPLGMAGGLSGAIFWRIELPDQTLILRRWPVEHPTMERLQTIHSVLRHAQKRGITFVPVPLATCNGQTCIELDRHHWELSPWMPGSADFVRDPRTAKLQAALQSLAQFHVAVADIEQVPQAVPSPAVARRLRRLQELLSDGARALTLAIDDNHWPELAPLAREAAAALPLAAIRAIALLEPVSRAPLPLQQCIRDIWHDHVLFTGDEVTGLVDFGALDIDTPAGDIARLLGSLVGDDRGRWKIGLDAYEIARTLSINERAALPGLDATATVIALSNWIRWIYIERREFPDRDRIVKRFARLMERMRALT